MGMEKTTPKPLYVYRDVTNAKAIIAWAKKQGFTTTLAPDDMHVTITYSTKSVDWMKMGQPWEEEIKVTKGGPRVVEPLGDKGAVVLFFNCNSLNYRHDSMVSAGASWDYEEYSPHITLTYDGAGVDLAKVEPYSGEIILGPEIFEPLDDSWSDNVMEKQMQKFQVTKVDKKLGIVFGWAIICKQNGQDYYDLNVDREGPLKGKRVPEHIPEEAMLKAAIDFAENSRISKEMHDGNETPNSMFVFPMTEDIAKGFGITTANTGLMVMYKPSPEALAKFESGEYTGFSIGGQVIEHETV